MNRIKNKLYEIILKTGKIIKIEARSKDEVFRKLRNKDIKFVTTKVKVKQIKYMNKLEINFIPCIPWKQIKRAWGKREYNKFTKWMTGQTCLEEGAYLSDIKYYVEQRNKGVKEPLCTD